MRQFLLAIGLLLARPAIAIEPGLYQIFFRMSHDLVKRIPVEISRSQDDRKDFNVHVKRMGQLASTIEDEQVVPGKTKDHKFRYLTDGLSGRGLSEESLDSPRHSSSTLDRH